MTPLRTPSIALNELPPAYTPREPKIAQVQRDKSVSFSREQDGALGTSIDHLQAGPSHGAAVNHGSVLPLFHPSPLATQTQQNKSLTLAKAKAIAVEVATKPVVGSVAAGAATVGLVGGLGAALSTSTTTKSFLLLVGVLGGVCTSGVTYGQLKMRQER